MYVYMTASWVKFEDGSTAPYRFARSVFTWFWSSSLCSDIQAVEYSVLVRLQVPTVTSIIKMSVFWNVTLWSRIN
jgi:hypothetical protein